MPEAETKPIIHGRGCDGFAFGEMYSALTHGRLSGIASGLRGGALVLSLLLAVGARRLRAGAGRQLRGGRQQLRAARRLDRLLPVRKQLRLLGFRAS